MSTDLEVTPAVTIPARDLSWSASRSSGPGGQNVNKVATKVDLRFDLDGTSAIDEGAKRRLRALARGRLDGEGRVVVTSQATRTQADNLEDAREKLAELIRAALQRPKRRRPTRPSRASKERRLTRKRQRSEKKRQRGKVTRDEG